MRPGPTAIVAIVLVAFAGACNGSTSEASAPDTLKPLVTILPAPTTTGPVPTTVAVATTPPTTGPPTTTVAPETTVPAIPVDRASYATFDEWIAVVREQVTGVDSGPALVALNDPVNSDFDPATFTSVTDAARLDAGTFFSESSTADVEILAAYASSAGSTTSARALVVVNDSEQGPVIIDSLLEMDENGVWRPI